MGETIDAIQDRLSFSNISDQVSEHVNNAVETAKEAVYDATIGKAVYFMKNIGNEISGSSMVRTAKDNPLPFILLGLGAGMLVYQGFSGRAVGCRRDGLTGHRTSCVRGPQILRPLTVTKVRVWLTKYPASPDRRLKASAEPWER